MSLASGLAGKPTILELNPDSIPPELRAIAAWVGFRLALRKGNWTKEPINIQTGELAQSDNPKTHTDFETARANYKRLGCDGIGLCRREGWVFIDLDGVLTESGELRPFEWASTILEKLRGRAYIERSITGTGIHAIARGKLPPGRRAFDDPAFDHTGYAFYDSARFLTFSGCVLPQSGEIRDLTNELAEIHRILLPQKTASKKSSAPPSPISLNDAEILDRARRASNGSAFGRLWDGEWQFRYASQSEADQALCFHLAFWTGRDPERIDSLFRQSGLYRDKWERDDYRLRTIESAIAQTAEVYSPGRNGTWKSENVWLSGSAESNGAQHSSSQEATEPSSPINWGVAWPKPLEEEAYYGLAGDLARTIEPHSEADPAGVLVQFLVWFGNAIGRSPYFVVGADRHYPNLFTTLVGPTSGGRKGSSAGIVSGVMDGVDPDWVRTRIQSGLSSGEGLIWAVRDPIEEQEPIKDSKTKRIIDYQPVITDAGVSDKRLLVLEPEFARVLQVASRESNTLSAVLRQSWDSGNLRVMTRNRPAVASGAHISIVGHITRGELLKCLDSTEAANGFGNRILWLCVRRSKLLPDGGEFHKVNLSPLLRRIEEALQFSRKAGELTRDEEAAELWRDVYGRLTADRFGMFGAVTSRAEAQTLRLSCLYALLDCSSRICFRHLAAALELWRYCENSARFIFGESLGDQTADAIIEALRNNPQGLTRHEITEKVFAKNKKADEITRALKVLVSHGLARPEMNSETGGRPRETWLAVNQFRRK